MAASTDRGSRGAVAALALLIAALGVVATLLVLFPPPSSRPALPDVERTPDTLLPLLILPLAGVLAVLVGGFLIPFLLRRREEGRLDAAAAFAAAGELRSRLPVGTILAILRPVLLGIGALLVGAALVTTLPLLIEAVAKPGPVEPTATAGLNLATLLSVALVAVVVIFILGLVVYIVRHRLANRPLEEKPEPLPPVETLVAEPLRYTAPSNPARPDLSPEVAALFASDEPAVHNSEQHDGGGGGRLGRLLLAPFRLVGRLIAALLVADYYLVRALLRLPLRLIGRGGERRVEPANEPLADLLAVSAERSVPPPLAAPVLITTPPASLMPPPPPVFPTAAPLVLELTPLPVTPPAPPAVAAPQPSLDDLLADLAVAAPPAPSPSVVEVAADSSNLFADIGSVFDTTQIADAPAAADVEEEPLALTDPFAGLTSSAVAPEPEPRSEIEPLSDPFADLSAAVAAPQAEPQRGAAPLPLADPFADLVPSPALPVAALEASPVELPPVLAPLAWSPEPLPLPFEPVPLMPLEPATVPTAPIAAAIDLALPLTIFVVATAPQSGKSTVATEAARLLETAWINSSAVIAERVERRLGLPYGYVAETRAADHEAFRPELIEEGDRMSAEGTSPGVECVRRGYRVIDGIRRREELEASVAEVRATGGRPLVICVRRPNAPALADNTEAAALEALADELIVNDAGLDQLRALTAAALQRHQAR